MEEREAKTCMERLKPVQLHGSGTPYSGPVDPRTKRRRLLDALQKIIDYA
jgi:hypothetical protein